jgi:DNA-binding Lrp family transcriptional regulator
VSVRHIGLVLDHLSAPAPVKLVALILADHADSDGVCWPSYRRIAERSCLSERTVRRHVHELIRQGVIRKLRTGGGVADSGDREWVTNRYRIDAETLAAMPALFKVVRDDHLGAPAKVVKDGHVVTTDQGGVVTTDQGGVVTTDQGGVVTTDQGGVVTTDQGGVVRDGHPGWSPVATKPSIEPSIRTVNSIKADSGVLRSDFEEWWEASGRVGSKADAWGLYRWWRTQGGAGRDELLAAVVNYRAHCTATNCFMQHGRTFLVKPTKTQAARWPEWASGEAHGSSDVAGVDRVSDVLEIGLEWMGGSHENASLGDRSVAGIGAGDREADPAVSEDARCGLPALRLAGGE